MKQQTQYMRKPIIVLLVAVSLIFTNMGCFSEDRDYIERKLSLTFDVPAGLNSIESHYFRVDDVYMFLNETLEINKLAKEGVTEITGSSAVLTSRQGGVDFSDIDKISVFAVSQTDKSLRKEMFYLENIPTRNLDELKLLTGLSNISSLIVDNKLDVEVRIQFRTFSTQTMRLDLDFGYLIFKN